MPPSAKQRSITTHDNEWRLAARFQMADLLAHWPRGHRGWRYRCTAEYHSTRRLPNIGGGCRGRGLTPPYLQRRFYGAAESAPDVTKENEV